MKELLIECCKALESVNGLVVKSEGVDCQFDDLLEKLSVEILKEPTTIEEYFQEWDTLISTIHKNEAELIELKQFRDEEEQRIITTVDFKELYGANNDKVRKNHVKKELSYTYDRINSLELSLNDNKRKISYIKAIVKWKTELISAEVGRD